MTAINLKNLLAIPAVNINQLVTSTLPAITTAVLVVVIANNMASMTWEILPSAPDTVAPLAVSHKAIQAAPAARGNNVYKQIPNWHLFGAVQKNTPKAVAPMPIAPKDAPDTQLRLTLKGVVASADMMDAWAIIADRMGNEDSYRIDSTLPGGATLKEIYTDRIILLHNGRLETLRLPKSNLTGSNVSSHSARSNRRSATKRNVNRRVNSSRSTGNINRVSSAGTATLKQYRNKIINDPQSVMNTVRAEPYRQAGRLKGYRIFPGRDKNLFGQIGLEPGDVVTSVNGIELDSPLKGLEIMQNITDATEVSVVVLRNGVRQTFVAPMN